EAPSGGVIPEPWRISSADHASYLSGGKWLSLDVEPKDEEKVIPEGGTVAGWDFQAASAGRYQVWQRYGLESIRSPFAWRIDGKDWQAIPDKTQPYIDLMDAGVWNELAWTKLGEADLAAGAHRIEVKVE